MKEDGVITRKVKKIQMNNPEGVWDSGQMMNAVQVVLDGGELEVDDLRCNRASSYT